MVHAPLLSGKRVMRIAFRLAFFAVSYADLTAQGHYRYNL